MRQVHRFLRRAHRWIGIFLGIWLLAVSLSGALLLFKEPYYRWQFPRLAEQPGEEREASLSRVMEEQERLGKLNRLTLIAFPRPGDAAFRLWYSDGTQSLVDPVTGSLIAAWHWSEHLPLFLFELHSHLLLGQTGKKASGLAGLILILLLVTAPVVWWPRRSGTSLGKMIPRDGSVSSLLRSHEALGLLFLIPSLLIVATGVALVFFSLVSAFLSNLLDEAPPAPLRQVKGSVRHGDADWDALAALARARLPRAELIYLYPPGPGESGLIFRFKLPGEWHPNGRSYVVIDMESGQVLQAIVALEQGQGSRLGHAIYPLHAAKFDSLWYSGLLFLVALSNSGLVILGYCSYWKRRRRKRGRAWRTSRGK